MAFNNIFKKREQIPVVYNVYPVISSFSNFEVNKNSTIFTCIRLIADAVSLLPLNLKTYTSKGKAEAWSHPLYRVVKQDPNFYETSQLFFHRLIENYFNYGNVFIFKNYEGDKISSLSIFNNVSVEYGTNGLKKYRIGDQVFTDDEILHIPSHFGYDGIRGKPITNYLEDVLQTIYKTNQYEQNVFDAGFSGKRLVLSLPTSEGMTNEILDNKAKALNEKYGGSKNSYKPLVKVPDYSFETIDTGSNIDDRIKELSSLKTFQEAEICKVFGVPLPLVNGTYQNNLEEIYQAFLAQAIQPITEDIEAYFLKLLPANERKNYSFDFDYANLEKSSYKTQIEMARGKVEIGVWSPNDAKKALSTGTYTAEGEKYFVSANLKSINDASFSSAEDVKK